MSGATKVVFASAGLRATFRDAGAPDRPLVVTFDSLNADLRLDRPGFGEAWLAQAGYDAVHVVSDRNGWYQDPDMPALLRAVRDAATGRTRVVTYGSSMGGYAAVRFAGRVGAHAAIALSPQFSIDPAKAPWERRWTDYARGLAFPLERPDMEERRPEKAFVVFDPDNRDRLHAEALAQRYAVTAAPVRYAGHPAGTFLAEAHLLSETVGAMIEDRFDLRAFRAQVRAARRLSAAWCCGVAQRQPFRRAALALQLASRAVEHAPSNPLYQRVLGDRLEWNGDLGGAEAALRRAWTLAPGEPSLRLRLATHLALHRGATEEVASLLARFHRLGVGHEMLMRRAVDVLVAAGAFEAARDEARAASTTLPRSRPLRLRAWGLAALLALPRLGPAALEALRRRELKRRRGRWEERLVGATGFEPATP